MHTRVSARLIIAETNVRIVLANVDGPLSLKGNASNKYYSFSARIFAKIQGTTISESQQNKRQVIADTHREFHSKGKIHSAVQL